MKTTRKIVSTPNGGGASENYYNNLTSDHDHILYEVMLEREPNSGSTENCILIIGAVPKATAQKYFSVTDNADEVDGKFPVLERPMIYNMGTLPTIANFMEPNRAYIYSQQGYAGSSANKSRFAYGVLVQLGSLPNLSTIRLYGVASESGNANESGNVTVLSIGSYSFTSLFRLSSDATNSWTAYLYRTRI